MQEVDEEVAAEENAAANGRLYEAEAQRPDLREQLVNEEVHRT
jgi:hypothetical protein